GIRVMKQKLMLLVLGTWTASLVLQADVLKLKSGSGIQGTLISANSREIVFLGVDGTHKTYSIEKVSGIDFAALPSAPAPQHQPATPAALTIPAGTQIAVRLIDSVDGKTAKAGMHYRGSIDDPVKVGSKTAIAKDADCTIEVMDLEAGKGVALRLRDVNVGGKVYSLSTEYAEVAATGTSKTKK